jgi:hypothetical protein
MSNLTPTPLLGVVTPEDLAAAYAGPAFVSNHFVAQPYGNSLRIAFLENYDLKKPSQFRTAVSIQQADLHTLIALLSAFANPQGGNV